MAGNSVPISNAEGTVLSTDGIKEGGNVNNPALEKSISLNNQYGSIISVLDTDFSARFDPISNLARNTENIGWEYYLITGGSTKTGLTKKAMIDGQIVILGEVNISGSQSLMLGFVNATLSIFVPGQQYLVSFYAWSEKEQWFWMRTGVAANGYGVRYIEANKLTRVWTTVVATAADRVDSGASPSVKLGLTTGSNTPLVLPGPGSNPNLFVGGIQIEQIPNDYKGGVAQIGDSTLEGSTGASDAQKDYLVYTNRQISTMLGALLRINIFNRATGGERLDQMDARFMTDIAPLAVNCSRVQIQGGLNDFGQGRTFEQARDSAISMVSKTTGLGLGYDLFTCTPQIAIGSDPVKEARRQAFNSWIKTTHPDNHFDIASVVEDPARPGYLSPNYWGDGVHYNTQGKISIARYIASRTEKFTWLKRPSTYQAVYQ